ncbi:DUF4350 domain-containing protein [Caenimonas sp. SL110]|uniref:DUF4350 domain-containing protein n=1 Tax=Caenimonas sp. SL110 TaxID=1450524 RepID=UPI0006545864|nr:DUF4350 domain-containing protein [Caenimonas sp. SL110]
MNQAALVRILLVVLLGAGALWLLTNTEWADVEVARPARGEAALNPHYATQSLLRKLGGVVVRRGDLDRLPPPGARLVLLSRHWDLFPDRAPRLRQWVEQGGHLVIHTSLVDHQGLSWLPLKSVPIKIDDAGRRKDRSCRDLTEPEPFVPTYGITRVMKVCASMSPEMLEPAAGARAAWELKGELGSEVMRIAVGRGSVTAFGPWALLDNPTALRAQNPLVIAATVQAQRGAEHWFVVEEARDPLIPWLWRQGWPAALLALLALGVFLWRGAVRFGPIATPADRNRRSMTEQIVGTAHFLQRHGPHALHQAQVRALHSTASRLVRRYAQLDHAAQMAAIAKATGVDGQMLSRAVATTPTPRLPGALAADLEVIETTRRLLQSNFQTP